MDGSPIAGSIYRDGELDRILGDGRNCQSTRMIPVHKERGDAPKPAGRDTREFCSWDISYGGTGANGSWNDTGGSTSSTGSLQEGLMARMNWEEITGYVSEYFDEFLNDRIADAEKRIFRTTETLVVNSLTGVVEKITSSLQYPCYCFWAHCPKHDKHWKTKTMVYWEQVMRDLASKRLRPVKRETGTWKDVTHTKWKRESANDGLYIDQEILENHSISEGPNQHISATYRIHTRRRVPGTFNRPGDMFAGIQPPSEEDLKKALKGMLPTISSKVELAVFLAELREAYRTLRQPVGALLKIWKSLNARKMIRLGNPRIQWGFDLPSVTLGQLARGNLWLQFGILTTTSDIRKLFSIASEQAQKALRILQLAGKVHTSHYILGKTKTSEPVYLTASQLTEGFLYSPMNADTPLVLPEIYSQGTADAWQMFGGSSLEARKDYLFTNRYPGEHRIGGVTTEASTRVSLRFKWDCHDSQGSELSYSEMEGQVLADLVGLNFDPNIVWELVPFSFVVDWFLTVGKWLESYEKRNFSPSVTMFDACWSQKVERRETFDGKPFEASETFRDVDDTDPGFIIGYVRDLVVKSTPSLKGELTTTGYRRHVFTPHLEDSHVGALQLRWPGLNQAVIGACLFG